MKKAIRCISFLLIIGLILAYISSVLSFKGGDSTYSMTKFYEQDEDSVDVLVLGSSHAFVDINPAILWKEYGIASYDLCGSIQPMWSSYHYLVEALKTQHPRLIVLEGYCLYPRDMYESLVIVSNNYGLKWSCNRMDALKASTPSWQLTDYLNPLNRTHNRYSYLTESDFRANQGNPLYENWKGYTYSTSEAKFDRPNISDVTESAELDNKIETYYRKILELARQSDIPIAVVISPYQNITEESQKVYNRGAEIAAEYGVNFYNFNLNYDSCDLDFETDIADDGSHLNYRGSEKYTKALGATLITDYPEQYVDRRGNNRYVSWEMNSSYYERTIYNLQFEQAENMVAAIELANDENYLILLSISTENEQTTALCSSLRDNGIDLPATSGAWIFAGDSKTPNLIAKFPAHLEPAEYDDLLITSDRSGYQFLFNGDDHTAVQGGTNLLIYDKVTTSIVTILGF